VTAVDLHPEDLLDRARRGEASPEEWQRLRTHLQVCSACRFEHVIAEDCGRAGAPTGEDAVLLARVRGGAARAVWRRAGMFGARPARVRRPTRLVYAAAAFLIFVGTVAAATTVARRVWRGPEVEPVASVESKVGIRHHRVVSSVAKVADAEELAAPASAEGLAEVAEPSAPVAPAPARVGHVRQVASADSPAELFARANAARRRGETREAARLYRELQRAFPGSSEELVSRVTLGRWMLDRLNDPAGALARFDSYLANPVHTALREEALIGRALALGRLGRETEERGAWTAFLAAFPGSVYAERARGRLETLR
jgi:hypothetical protein